MKVKKYVSKKTRTFRQSIMLKTLKVVTPRLYQLLNSHITLQLPRPMIKFSRQHFNNKPLIGAEIGVLEGLNAKSILQTLNMKKLFLIDPYTKQTVKNRLIDRQPTFGIAVKRLSRYKNKIEWIRKKSEDALGEFPDDFFDFVYIDGNHDYDYVKKDLEGYWCKVRKGGVIGGHDFYGDCVDVCRAVVDFSNRINKPFFGEMSDFWFIKE